MRSAAAVLLAVLVLSSCGADEERPAPAAAEAGTTRFSDERQGFEVTFPSGWMRADTVLTPTLGDPREILSVGTVEPVANGASSSCARDAFVTIQERANPLSSEMRPGPPQLDAVVPDDSESSQCVGRDVPFRTYWMPFELGGRGFYANAALGDDAPPELRAELQAVLDSFEVLRHGG